MNHIRFLRNQFVRIGLAVGLGLPTLALAQQTAPDGYYHTPNSYGWVEVGGSLVPEFSSTLQSSLSSFQQQGTFEMKPGFAANGGFGQWLDTWLAMEVQAGFLYNGIDSFQPDNADSVSFSGSLMQVPMLLNGMVEAPLKGRIKPFAGAGFGAVMSWLNVDQSLDLGESTPVSIDGSSTEFSFAYQLSAGVRYDLPGDAFVALTYRYLGAGSPTWSLKESGSGQSVANLSADSINVHSLTLGFFLGF